MAVANCTDGEVRLVDGPSTNKGRLEVCHNQAWTTVCNNGFGTEESRVVCGQLGFQRYGNAVTVISHINIDTFLIILW